MATRLDTAPNYKEVRSIAAPSADSTTLTLANFPLADAFDPRKADEILLYWYATGDDPSHWVIFDILQYDGARSLWITGTRSAQLPPSTVARLEVHRSNLVTVRIQDLSATGATNMSIRAALVEAAY